MTSIRLANKKRRTCYDLYLINPLQMPVKSMCCNCWHYFNNPSKSKPQAKMGKRHYACLAPTTTGVQLSSSITVDRPWIEWKRKHISKSAVDLQPRKWIRKSNGYTALHQELQREVEKLTVKRAESFLKEQQLKGENESLKKQVDDCRLVEKENEALQVKTHELMKILEAAQLEKEEAQQNSRNSRRSLWHAYEKNSTLVDFYKQKDPAVAMELMVQMMISRNVKHEDIVNGIFKSLLQCKKILPIISNTIVANGDLLPEVSTHYQDVMHKKLHFKYRPWVWRQAQSSAKGNEGKTHYLTSPFSWG